MPRRRDMPCASCGQLMWRGPGVLPPGQATCRTCRAKARNAAAQRTCAVCNASFAGDHRRRYCSVSCSNRARRNAHRQPKPSATQRGYGTVHRRTRSEAVRAFVPGTPCPMCTRPMNDPHTLDLAHCPECGRPFASTSLRICCSPWCDEERNRVEAREGYRRRHRERFPANEPAWCAECGSRFIRISGRQIDCGAACTIAREFRRDKFKGMRSLMVTD